MIKKVLNRKKGLKRRIFPRGFLWGAATSSHQVEGGCFNNWTDWEKKNAQRLAREAGEKWQSWQKKQFPEMFEVGNYISGKACDQFNLYEKDFDLAKLGGHSAHRFSIEWSRIEPKEGVFDGEAIEHYRRLILALKKRGIEPFVTLWHWTDPVWLEALGGWNNKKVVGYFSRFVEKVVSEYQDLVKFWVVINEPNVVSFFGYYLGVQPPGKKGILNFLTAFLNLLEAFKVATKKIKQISPRAEVGVANSITYYEVDIFPGFNFLVSYLIKFFSNYFLRKSVRYSTFIGCNYYSCARISLKRKKIPKEKLSDLGWEIFPEGIYFVLKELKKYNLPIYITENGLADSEDKKREAFIFEHLKFIHKAISEGINVRGYFYWSLLDNFEFPAVRGFWPRFGLLHVNFKNQKRTPRSSFYFYKEVIKNNGIVY